MILRPPISNVTDTLFPDTALFRAKGVGRMVRLLFLILLSALAGPLAAQSAPADTSAAAAPSPSVATIGPLATEAFARLPFVEKPALSPDGKIGRAHV